MKDPKSPLDSGKRSEPKLKKPSQYAGSDPKFDEVQRSKIGKSSGHPGFLHGGYKPRGKK